MPPQPQHKQPYPPATADRDRTSTALRPHTTASPDRPRPRSRPATAPKPPASLSRLSPATATHDAPPGSARPAAHIPPPGANDDLTPEQPRSPAELRQVHGINRAYHAIPHTHTSYSREQTLNAVTLAIADSPPPQRRRPPTQESLQATTPRLPKPRPCDPTSQDIRLGTADTRTSRRRGSTPPSQHPTGAARPRRNLQRLLHRLAGSQDPTIATALNGSAGPTYHTMYNQGTPADCVDVADAPRPSTPVAVPARATAATLPPQPARYPSPSWRLPQHAQHTPPTAQPPSQTPNQAMPSSSTPPTAPRFGPLTCSPAQPYEPPSSAPTTPPGLPTLSPRAHSPPQRPKPEVKATRLTRSQSPARLANGNPRRNPPRPGRHRASLGSSLRHTAHRTTTMTPQP